jgi:hypothetical protein
MRTLTQARRPAPLHRPRVRVAVSYLMWLIVRPATTRERRSISQTAARMASAGYAVPQEKKNDVPVNQIGNLKMPALSKSR